MEENIEYIDFEFERIKDSILDSKVIKKDKLNLILDFLENCNNLETCLLSGNGKTTLIRKLTSKWNVVKNSKRISELVYSNPSILLEVLKGKMVDVLYDAPDSVYTLEYNGKNIVEYLFELNLVNHKNIHSLLKFPNIFLYVKKYNIRDFDLIDLNNYLLLKKSNKLLLDELIESDIDKIHNIYSDDIVNEIISKKAFILLKNVNYSLLWEKYKYDGNEKLLLDIIYENDVNLPFDTLNDLFLYGMFYRDFNSIIDVMYKYGKFTDLKMICYENLLLHKLPNGKILLEELFINGIFPTMVNRITDLRLISLILDYNVEGLYHKIDISSWLKNYDINNTFLDILLYKDSTVNLRKLFRFSDENLSAYDYSKFVMIFAKHGKLNKINYNLSYESDIYGKSVLNCLLDTDMDFTLNNILSENDKKKFNIDLLLEIHDFKSKIFNINDSIDKSFISEQSKKYSCGEISLEAQNLLDEFYFLMNDGNSSMELIDMCLDVYKKLFFDNNPCAYDLIHLINFKKENPGFKIVESFKSSFSPKDCAVYINSKNVSTLMHELGHVIHLFVQEEVTPDEFTEFMKKHSFYSKMREFYDEFNKFSKLVHEYSKIIVEEEYQSSLDMTDFDKLCEYLSNESSSLFSKLLSNSKPKTLEEFIKKDKKIKSKMLADYYIRSSDDNIAQIADILDALCLGDFTESFHIDYGHGAGYYRGKEFLIFCEVFADYSSIIKSPNCELSLNTLKKYVGEEFCGFMDKYYYEMILGEINRYEKETVI